MSTEQKKDLNQYYLDTYTKEASVYDQRRWTSKGGSKAKSLRNAYFFDILRKYNLIQPEKKIIDVASGTGRVALELVTFGYKKVVACDLTNAMLDVSRSKLPAQYKDIHRVLQKDGILVCEVMNQLHFFNPFKAVMKFWHRHVRGKKIKSHAYPWELKKAFAPFEVVDIIGTDFPAVMTIFGDGFLRFLSRSPLTKYFGGRFVVGLKK